MSTLVIILKTSPNRIMNFQTAKNLARSASIQRIAVTLLLVTDGIYCAIKPQKSTQNNIASNLFELMKEGVSICISASSLTQRGFKCANSVINNIKCLEDSKISEIITDADKAIFLSDD